jgi:hypothetical protein
MSAKVPAKLGSSTLRKSKIGKVLSLVNYCFKAVILGYVVNKNTENYCSVTRRFVDESIVHHGQKQRPTSICSYCISMGYWPM